MADLVSKSSVLDIYAELYDVFDDNKAVQKELDKVYDKLRMLKEQKPVIPKEERLNDVDSIYRCGNCGTHFYYRQQKYCAICGREAKWNAND